jgi:hypothetical protein
MPSQRLAWLRYSWQHASDLVILREFGGARELKLGSSLDLEVKDVRIRR